jgi:hypothetical protein
MKWALVFVIAAGCGTTSTAVETYSANIEQEQDASPAECPSIRWYFGGSRHCDQCTCPGAQCQTSDADGGMVSGVCGEDLECSAACTDPLWIEMFGQ